MYWICVYWVSILSLASVMQRHFRKLQKASEGFRRHEAYALKAQNKDHAYFGSQASKPSEVSEPILGFPDAQPPTAQAWCIAPTQSWDPQSSSSQSTPTASTHPW
ncbi:hypothetical protein BS47DRAFT_1367314 [Hydnum rufescens UP504]|uniref:Uncharacterized protein n=1 Tax=Hydnum rufescens UP504 TaxID=1448309 RepID=A0A9P6DPQ1_9AGAM|nr:hypothetical protein BS47DRAFT_1367314 [Hydnum rufescens UP504]